MSAVEGTMLVSQPINLSGILYNKTRVDTPLFNMFGSRSVQGRKFITGATYDLGYPSSVSAISESASLTAPDPEYWERENAENVTQIFQRSLAISYRKMANSDDLINYQADGYEGSPVQQPAIVGNTNNVPNELAWQLKNTMDAIRLDLEWTILNGEYQDGGGAAATADKTRGIIEATASNVIDADGSELTFEVLYDLAQEIMLAGTPYGLESYIFVMPYEQYKQLQKVVADEGLKLNQSRAGVNVTEVITPFGTMRFLPHRFMPAGTVQAICVPVVKNVFQPTPGKGNFFFEPLAKTGAAEKGQVFGMYGLDHGVEFLHAKVTDLAESTAPFTAPKRYIENAGGGSE